MIALAMLAALGVLSASGMFGIGPARAASFDCAKAKTPDEVAVCKDALLSELDDLMADLYARLRHFTQNFDNAMGLQAQLVDAAREFLKKRARCGGDIRCLERVYRARNLELLNKLEMEMREGAVRFAE